jgi:hypothetical protein
MYICKNSNSKCKILIENFTQSQPLCTYNFTFERRFSMFFLWGYANTIDASHLPCRVLGYYLPSVENGGLSRLSLEVS